MTLSDAVRGCVKPMEPIGTGIPCRLPELPGIRAVIFDIYGTLLISETGDIAAAEDSLTVTPTEELEELMQGLGITASLTGLEAAFSREVRFEHERMKPLEPYPEIEADRLWARILGLDGERSLLFAAAWEASVNKAWAMPSAAETLRSLRSRGYLLGIVSNAQAYTLPLFPLLLGDTLEGFAFEKDLSLFSWQEGRGKPSPRLFADLVAALGKRGLSPGDALIVGNDMLKDMASSREAGLRTCLFAGDRRSLKLRKDDPRCDFEPDAVVTDLGQLLRFLPRRTPCQ